MPYPSDAELFEEEERIRSGHPPTWIQRDCITKTERWERTKVWLREGQRQRDIDNADEAAIERFNLEREKWERMRAWVREGAAQWRKEHPEEAEAARLKDENVRLQNELRQAEAREAEHVRRRSSNHDVTLTLAVYFGGGFLIWLLFSGTHPARAWNAPAVASWWDILAMYVLLGWGIGGIPAGSWVANWLRWRRPKRDTL